MNVMFLAISSLLILSGILSYSTYVSFCCVISIKFLYEKGGYRKMWYYFYFGVKLYLHLSRISKDVYNVYVSKATICGVVVSGVMGIP